MQVEGKKRLPENLFVSRNGVSVSLAELQKKHEWILICLYCDTGDPHSRKQLMGIRDNMKFYRANDVAIVAVGPEDPETLNRYRKRDNLNMILCSDSDNVVLKRLYTIDKDETTFRNVQTKASPIAGIVLVDKTGLIRHLQWSDAMHDISDLKAIHDILFSHTTSDRKG